MSERSGASSPWWEQERHRDRRPFLLARNQIKSAIRAWFEAEGFIEVDPAILQRSPGNELHLHAFATKRQHPDGSPAEPLYLHTSPEFAMKKLLAAGEHKLFAFSHCFRNREAGPSHSSEFTMLEWYRTGATLDGLMSDCQALLQLAAASAGTTMLRHRARQADPKQPADRMHIPQAITRHAGIDLLATLDDPANPNRQMLADAATHAGIRIAADDNWSDIFQRILLECIEPAMSDETATFLLDYPRTEAALARADPADPRLARRFELFACGLELANAFEELTDACEQRARFEADMAAKERLYGERYPIDDGLLDAIAQMPPTAGIALGFERLVMLATGASRIEQVMWTPAGG